MNDVLAVIMVCLAKELVYPTQNIGEDEIQESKVASDKEISFGNACMNKQPDEAFNLLHSTEYYWSEAFRMFERIMELGVKDIYYREDVELIEQSSDIINDDENMRRSTKASSHYFRSTNSETHHH